MLYLLLEDFFYYLEGMKSRNLVNGQENEPRMQYDSIQASPPVNGGGNGDEPPVRDPRRPPPPPPAHPPPRPAPTTPPQLGKSL